MTKQEHELDIEKLKSLETDLIKRIAKLMDEELMNIYSEWSKQRAKCNEGFSKLISEGINKANKNKQNNETR